MKKEYQTPLTDIVFLSIGKLLEETGGGNMDSVGDSEEWYNNNSTFDVEETVEFQGGRSLWED